MGTEFSVGIYMAGRALNPGAPALPGVEQGPKLQSRGPAALQVPPLGLLGLLDM